MVTNSNRLHPNLNPRLWRCTWESPCDCDSGGLNSKTNVECFPYKKGCKNQPMGSGGVRKYARTHVQDVGERGKGLFARQDISAGEYIMQYTGEILGQAEYERRFHWDDMIGRHHSYYMDLGEVVVHNMRDRCVIDASRYGNDARFINHSCEPNAETQKWNVKGFECVGIFALRDIRYGEEITFDYHAVRQEEARVCLCGASTCRKYI